MHDVQPEDRRIFRRNLWSFGLGTLGRDMLAAMVAMFLMVYLTEVLNISSGVLAAVTVVLVVMRVFDAVNDPFMGLIVDNTRTRWGKFKPWIALGAVLWAGASVVLFTDWGLTGTAFVVMFTLVYLVWEVAYTINDISYYGLLPSLSRVQAERERIGVVARISANVGLFSLVVLILPVTAALGERLGSLQQGWFWLAVVLSVVMVAFQTITLVGARQQVMPTPQHTPVREILSVIVKNDQLLWVTAAMVTFMTGYTTTTALGVYYFKYVYGDEGMYPVFAAILGVTQIAGLLAFPTLSRFLSRRQIHLLASVLAVAGYVVFLLAGTNMWVIGLAGVLLFSGQAFIQLLMLMFITDCVEYGQWKLGRRNESITVALQPFIYKGANALASGIVGVTLIITGINDALTPADVSAGGITLFKVSMMVIPMALVAVSWLILARTYKIDEVLYGQIVNELHSREEADVSDHEA